MRALGLDQIRISKSEFRNKFKAQILQCSKQEPSGELLWSFEFGTLDFVSARPGATFSVHIGVLVGASIRDLSTRSIFAGSGPGISCFEFRIYNLPGACKEITAQDISTMS